MSRRRRGRARGDTNSSELSVYDLANKLKECKKTKNAVPNLPSTSTEEEANNFLGLMCLIECKSPVGKRKFDKKYVGSHYAS